ncbi:RNA polymerase sigma factor [Acidicapsa ligni]|uniref:RNA polymerase sigma factor n=1 Tax=Acidicapsa ligni TaxID=542300 RepID=UPI0021E05381|nr:RNA polymerase sigma factor [Acidicapsa ligni]
MSAQKLQKIDKSRDHEQVFLNHYDWLLKWARQLAQGSREEAEDLVQDLYVRFVQSKAAPDLTDDDRLRGYLYRTLKHLFISRKLRNGGDALSSLLVVDFDSLEYALTAVDRSQLLLVRSDLASICEYACIRRSTHRAANALILRFFLGYFPSEVVALLQTNRAAADKLIQTARLEARTFLAKPANLHFMGLDTKRTPRFPAYLPDDPTALLAELRRRIFSEPEGACLSELEIEEKYHPTSELRLTTPELAHLLSCSSCLDQANKTLGLPTLSQRLSSEGGDHDDSDPSTPRIDDQGPRLRRKFRETFEHRPMKLQVAVNGEVHGVQLITSVHSKFQIKLKPLTRLEFVEVLSEQGVRLLYHDLEDGDIDNPVAQSAEVQLSDDRKLTVVVTLEGGVPVVEVSYFDPLVEESSVVDAATFSSGKQNPTRTARSHQKPHSGWTKFVSWLRDINWTWSRNLVIAALTVLMIALSFIVADRQIGRTKTPIASRLLAEAQHRGEAAIPIGGAAHRTFSFEVRSGNGELLQSGRVETLRGHAPSRTALKLLSANGKLLAGQWTNGAGKQSRYPSKSGLSPDASQTATSEAWMNVPEADGFERITGDPTRLSVVHETDSYRVSYGGAEGPHKTPIVSAQLVLASDTMRPVAETIRIEDRTQTREYRFKELSYELVSPSKVRDSDFEIDPSLVAPVSGTSVLPMPIPSGGDAHLALQVFQLLSNLGPDVERLLDVDRSPDGSVVVSGVLPSQEQKNSVAHVFGSLDAGHRLRLALHSSDEPVETSGPHGPLRVESLPAIPVENGHLPFDAELRAGLTGQGLSGHDLDVHIGQVATDALDRAARLHREAWTIRQIAAHGFRVEELQSMQPNDKMLWLTLLDKHTRSYAQELGQLDAALTPLLPIGEAPSSSTAPPPTTLKELGAVAEALNLDSERLDQVLTSGLTLSPTDPPTTHNVPDIAELLADLRIEESMLHETVERLQAARP